MTDRTSLPRPSHSRDVAQILGVSTVWLERKRLQKQPLRCVRVRGPVGRAVRYRENDLLDYIEENTFEFQSSID